MNRNRVFGLTRYLHDNNQIVIFALLLNTYSDGSLFAIAIYDKRNFLPVRVDFIKFKNGVGSCLSVRPGFFIVMPGE